MIPGVGEYSGASVGSPNILTVYDIGRTTEDLGGAPFIVAELLEGEELRDALNGFDLERIC